MIGRTPLVSPLLADLIPSLILVNLDFSSDPCAICAILFDCAFVMVCFLGCLILAPPYIEISIAWLFIVATSREPLVH
jgi:hypothetical protein